MYQMEIGGCEVLLVDLLNELCKNNDISLIILNNQTDKNLMCRLSKKIKVYCLKRKPGSRNPVSIFKLNVLLSRIRPDIVHCHVSSMIRIILSRRFKVILTIHDVNIHLSFMHKYDYLVAVSDAVYLDIRSRCRYPIGTVNNGVPDSLFKKRNEYFLGENESLKLIQVSRLVHKKKGQDILLKALYTLVYEYKMPAISLEFAGAGESMQYLKDLTSTLKLEDHVSFPGERSRDWLYNHLSEYHALLQPSRYEGFGLTIVEGLKAGLPVVASKIDGPAQILAGRATGFLFEVGSSAGCARQIKHLFNLYKNGKLTDMMKIATLQEKPYYSMTACSDGYVEVYKKVINNSSALHT
ncbi:MAG: glycosyltransferase [Chitinophagaceae bacterium]